MLGLSLPKILILAAIVIVIWYWSKGLRQDAKSSREDEPTGHNPDTETLKACPVCKAYVVEGAAKSCGRPDCPY
jgi:hypothetical protein